MRKWALYLIILIAVAAMDLSVFYGTDVGKLLPVEVVRLSKENGQVVLETDTDNLGVGTDLDAAIENLKATTSGNVFLETADYLIVAPGCTDLLADLKAHLRPSCGICMETGTADLEDAAKFLDAHEPQLTLQDWYSGILEMPTLIVRGEQMELVQGKDPA